MLMEILLMVKEAHCQHPRWVQNSGFKIQMQDLRSGRTLSHTGLRHNKPWQNSGSIRCSITLPFDTVTSVGGSQRPRALTLMLRRHVRGTPEAVMGQEALVVGELGRIAPM